MAPVILLLSSTAISGYVAALMTTTVADVLVIYATLPFIAAGLAFLFIGERPSRRTMIAAGVALVGVGDHGRRRARTRAVCSGRRGRCS